MMTIHTFVHLYLKFCDIFLYVGNTLLLPITHIFEIYADKYFHLSNIRLLFFSLYRELSRPRI